MLVMEDQEIINKIICTSSIIEDKEIENDERIRRGIEACKLYKKLKVASRAIIVKNIYLIYRQMGALYYEANEYEMSEDFF